jgi:hypothetical protein
VLRQKTERPEGLGSSAMVSAESSAVADFVNSLASRKQGNDFSAFNPSAAVVGHLLRAFSTPQKSPDFIRGLLLRDVAKGSTPRAGRT